MLFGFCPFSSSGGVAALPRTLIIQEEESNLLLNHRAADASAENILLNGRALLAAGVQEELVGVEHIVAEIFVHVSVKRARARLQDRVDIAAAVATLAGVVQRRLHLEFLDGVWVR